MRPRQYGRSWVARFTVEKAKPFSKRSVGLADLDLVVALFEALHDAGNCFRISRQTGRVYTDLLVAAEGLADQEIRRWYPDDILICLIARVAPANGWTGSGDLADSATRRSVTKRRNRISDLIWKDVKKEYARQQKLSSGDQTRILPSEFKGLLESIRIVMHSELPSVLAEYASRRVDCRSLLGPSIGRIYGDPAIARKAAPVAEDEHETVKAMEQVHLKDEELYGGDSPNDAEPDWLPDLRKALAGEDCKEFSRKLNSLLEVQPSVPPRQRFCAFALRLVERGSSYGSKLTPSTIRCLGLTAARRVGGVLGDQDPAGYPAAALETLYLRVIEDAKTDAREPLRMQK